jgi:hypothetical protein
MPLEYQQPGRNDLELSWIKTFCASFCSGVNCFFIIAFNINIVQKQKKKRNVRRLFEKVQRSFGK